MQGSSSYTARVMRICMGIPVRHCMGNTRMCNNSVNPFSFYTRLVQFRKGGNGWSLSQLSLGERQGMPWTGHQSITGQHGDKQDTQPNVHGEIPRIHRENMYTKQKGCLTINVCILNFLENFVWTCMTTGSHNRAGEIKPTMLQTYAALAFYTT